MLLPLLQPGAQLCHALSCPSQLHTKMHVAQATASHLLSPALQPIAVFLFKEVRLTAGPPLASSSLHTCAQCCEAVHEDKTRMDHQIQRAAPSANPAIAARDQELRKPFPPQPLRSANPQVISTPANAVPRLAPMADVSFRVQTATEAQRAQNIMRLAERAAQEDKQVSSKLQGIEALQRQQPGDGGFASASLSRAPDDTSSSLWAARASAIPTAPPPAGIESVNDVNDLLALYGSAEGSRRQVASDLQSCAPPSTGWPLNHPSLRPGGSGLRDPMRSSCAAPVDAKRSSSNNNELLRMSMNDIDVLNSPRRPAGNGTSSVWAHAAASPRGLSRDWPGDGRDAVAGYPQPSFLSGSPAAKSAASQLDGSQVRPLRDLRSNSSSQAFAAAPENDALSAIGHRPPLRASSGSSAPKLPEPAQNAGRLEIETPKCGLGVRLRHSNRGLLSVAAILPGGAADVNGQLKEGDQILAVDSAETFGKPIQDVARMFVGNEGTVVDLRICREGEVPFHVCVVRKAFQSQTCVPEPRAPTTQPESCLPGRPPPSSLGCIDGPAPLKQLLGHSEPSNETKSLLSGDREKNVAAMKVTDAGLEAKSAQKSTTDFEAASARVKMQLQEKFPQLYSEQGPGEKEFITASTEPTVASVPAPEASTATRSPELRAVFEESPFKAPGASIFLHSDAPLFQRPTRRPMDFVPSGASNAAAIVVSPPPKPVSPPTTRPSPTASPEFVSVSSASSSSAEDTPPDDPADVPAGIPPGYTNYAAAAYVLPDSPQDGRGAVAAWAPSSSVVEKAKNNMSSQLDTKTKINRPSLPPPGSLASPDNIKADDWPRASMTPESLAAFVRTIQISPTARPSQPGQARNDSAQSSNLSLPGPAAKCTSTVHARTVMMKNGNDLLEPVEAEEEAWAVEMQREEEEAAVAASTNQQQVLDACTRAPRQQPSSAALEALIVTPVSKLARLREAFESSESNAIEPKSTQPTRRDLAAVNAVAEDEGVASSFAGEDVRDDVSARTNKTSASHLTTETERDREKEREDGEMSARCTDSNQASHAEQSPTSRTSTTPSPREATNETLAGGRLEVPHGQSYLVIHVA